MLQLYTWTTPNGIKPLILLEELGLPYETRWVNLGHGEQHADAFRRLNPNAKIPVLVDNGAAIFESGAILVHLAERSGKFLPQGGVQRAQAFEWLFFQVGGVGPMFGQLNHFLHSAQQIPYAIERYSDEVKRLYGVLDQRLMSADYLAGEYGIADIATVGWASLHDTFGLARDTIPHVVRWLERIAERPAVQRARALRP